MTPKETLCNQQRKSQLEFDEMCYSFGVMTLMAVAAIVVLPAIIVLEKLDVIKKVRHD